MNNLELCKKFAELEGVDTIMHRGELYRLDLNGGLSINSVSYGKYNPIGGELNCAARDKYHVEIDYDLNEVNIYTPSKFDPVIFDNTKDIPNCVIKCILKSKGLI